MWVGNLIRIQLGCSLGLIHVSVGEMQVGDLGWPWLGQLGGSTLLHGPDVFSGQKQKNKSKIRNMPGLFQVPPKPSLLTSHWPKRVMWLNSTSRDKDGKSYKVMFQKSWTQGGA